MSHVAATFQGDLKMQRALSYGEKKRARSSAALAEAEITSALRSYW